MSKRMGRFKLWLENALPGDSYVYHVGPNCLLSKDGEEARRAYDRGDIELVQSRLSWGRAPNNTGSRFEYIAQKRKRATQRDNWFVDKNTGWEI